MSEATGLVNVYHNGQTPPKPAEQPQMTAFYRAADPVLAAATELARVVVRSHQAATTLLINGDWSQARKYFSLSGKYTA